MANKMDDDGRKAAKKKKHAKATEVKKRKLSKSRPADLFNGIKLLRSSLLYQTKEFFENSTLHGVRYIAEEGRPFVEKFMWFCFVATGAVAAIVIIFSLWEKFQTNPTITGLDTDFHNQEVIFPTVMVCPERPFDEKSVHDVAYVTLANYEEGSEQYEPFLEVLTKLSYGEAIREAVVTAENFSDAKELANRNLRKLVFKMAVRCNATFGFCRYKDEPIDCCGSFKPVYSEHGFCYSFNSRYIGQDQEEERNSDTKYLYETDKKWGLTFAPLRKSDVFVHSHNEISGWDFRPQVQWDEGFAIDFLISMKQTYTTEDARQLSIGQRKCIFPDEVKLRYYQDEYTFSGCMKECRLRKCLKYCGCIPPFYAPPVSLRMCTASELPCVASNVGNITSIGGCQHCELGCHNTVYDIEKYSKVGSANSSMTTEAGKEPVVTIEYLTWPVIRYKREVLFGWVDLLVSFGGIAGLFLGFSLLSGVEIIYFFTMRACCMLYKNRNHLETLEREKLERPPDRYDLGLRPDFQRPNAAPQPVPSKDFSPQDPRNVITLSLVEQEFNAVKVPKEQGLVLGGLGAAPVHRRLERRLEKMNIMIRPDFSRSVHVAPYSERIKPLDRNVILTKDGGILYNGYLP